jgi:hypothetical protein
MDERSRLETRANAEAMGIYAKENKNKKKVIYMTKCDCRFQFRRADVSLIFPSEKFCATVSICIQCLYYK